MTVDGLIVNGTRAFPRSNPWGPGRVRAGQGGQGGTGRPRKRTEIDGRAQRLGVTVVGQILGLGAKCLRWSVEIVNRAQEYAIWVGFKIPGVQLYFSLFGFSFVN